MRSLSTLDLLVFLCYGLASSCLSLDDVEVQARREYFYVGGKYVNVTIGNTTTQRMTGQIYVEKLTPAKVTQEHAIVFIPGAGQTGTNFLNTPDNRPGWASYFLHQGYTIYLTDQPERGRSPWLPGSGTLATFSANDIETLFTATRQHTLWPQSQLHTEWPGDGRQGDPIFDAFYASQVQLQSDALVSEANNAHAYTALLDRIGSPAYLLTHSQAGAYGWRVVDARPHLVKGVVALEPAGPPFVAKFPWSGPQRAWGITELEVAYEPDAGPRAERLETVVVPPPEGDEGVNRTECVLQREPAKRLRNLESVPVLVVTGEASFHAPYEYCIVEYMRQAGVDVEFLDLGRAGVKGNGHMMFMEKNNMEIAERIGGWLGKNVQGMCPWDARQSL